MKPGPEHKPQQQPARGVEGARKIFGPQIQQDGQPKTAPENGQDTKRDIEKAQTFAYQKSVEDVNARFLRERMGL